MNEKRNIRKRVLTGTLALLMIFLFLTPHQLSAGVCERALAKCGIDALLTSLLSGPEIGALYLSGCLLGYSWCLQYYDF
jgi:hypothetical protein